MASMMQHQRDQLVRMADVNMHVLLDSIDARQVNFGQLTRIVNEMANQGRAHVEPDEARYVAQLMIIGLELTQACAYQRHLHHGGGAQHGEHGGGTK